MPSIENHLSTAAGVPWARPSVRAVVPEPMAEALGRRAGRRPARTPAAGARLVWHERRVEQLPQGQTRITVPLLGGTLTADDSAALTRLLNRLWVASTVPAARFSSVVATIEDVTSPRRHLTLLVASRDRTTSPRRTDDIAMVRQLRTALAQVERHSAAPENDEGRHSPRSRAL